MRLSLLPNVPRRRGNDRRRRRFHPAILYLEDRQLLTGYTLTTLASFNGTNGDAPYAGLVMNGQGNLYGTTDYGGASGHGAVYEVANGSNSITTLASFNGTDGSYPSGGLVMDGQGNLYGTASSGGANGDGTVFEVANGSNSITTLASLNGADGSSPVEALLLNSQGNLYGTARYGGASGDGTVFEVANGSNVITSLASFNGTNGDAPYVGLVMDGQGNLYGTTRYGGADGIGAVFEIAKGSNAITNLASFNGSNGMWPEGSLILDGQGNLYGTAEYGGASGDGAVFEIANGSNTITNLASFNGTNGISPEAGLVMDGQGNLYDTTVVGGASGDGTVFEIASGSNTITTLASFSGTNGAYSEAGLILDGQGNLYGTTTAGGASGDGTVFELKTSNPIIAATSLTWDTTQGGVDYGYTISNADLPQPTTAALYWAPTATFDPTQDKLIPGSVFTTANAAQTDPYTGHIDAATIGTPPQGTEDLLFVIDPTNRISPANPNKVASWKSDLSGLAWLMAEGVSQKPNVGTYPNSMLVSDLDPSFQSKVESFISALQSAGASISILSTRRSKERAYLMHYAWGIAQGQISPAAVPQMYGIDIRWDYGDDAVSQQAAKQMVDFFGMTNDAALNSRHIQGLAIDMSVSWVGVLKIRNAAGRVVRIASVPKNANNAALARVAAAYGVYRDFADAAPHWSSDGL